MHKDPLQLANEALDKAIDTEKRNKAFLTSIGPSIVNALSPALEGLKEAVSKLKVDVKPIVEVNPEFKIPKAEVTVNQDPIDTSGIERALRDAFGNFRLPESKINYNPNIQVPPMKWPEGNMPIEGIVTLKGVDRTSPLPVELRDSKGNPVSLDVQNYIGGSGGGKGIVKVSGIINSALSDYINADNRLRVSVETGGSGLTDAELRAAHLDVQQLSGSVDSVNIVSSVTLEALQLSGSIYSVKVTGFDTSVAASIVDSSGVGYSGSNPLPVTASITGSITSSGAYLLNGDGVYRDTIPVQGTVTVSDITNSIKTALIDSTGVQYSGANPLPTYNAGIATATQSFNLVDSTAVAYSGSNPVPVLIAGTSTATTSVYVVDSSGVGYNGSNQFPVTVNGATNSVIAVGPVASDGTEDNSAPLKMGGVARQANPTAVSAGDMVSATMDDLGRQVMRPVQVRDLIQTAYASVTTGTETTLYQSASGVFSDLIYIMCSNQSDVATYIDIRSGTANGIVMTVEVPASGTAGVSLPVPIPQDVAANTWTVDMPDITGTTINVSALFSKEV